MSDRWPPTSNCRVGWPVEKGWQRSLRLFGEGAINVNDFKLSGFGPLNIGPVIYFAIEVEVTKCRAAC